MSLRLRLTLLNGLVLLLALWGFATVAYLTQREALLGSLDASLHEQARWFNDNAEVWFDPRVRRPRGVTFPNPSKFSAPEFFIQITMRDGESGGRSLSLESDSLPGGSETLRRALGGASWIEETSVDGQPLRMLTAPLRVGDGPPVGMVQVARPLAPLQTNLAVLRNTLLTVGALGILAAVVMGWLLARAALQPIHDLATAAHAIGLARDFGRRVPLSQSGRRDEVGRLAEEFNRMLAQLQTAYKQLEAALAAERRFVADASHELRTPLTTLRGNLDLLRTTPASADEREQILADLAVETERLSRLVADLLLLAQADSGQHLPLAPVEVAPLVRDAFRAARFLRQGVELRLEEPASEVWVLGDGDRLKQLLLILLDNALKYTPEGGQVSIGARVTNGGQALLPVSGSDRARQVALYVADTGPGISQEDQSRIFERFYRGDPGRPSGGAGLGLAIARWIAEEHRGHIEVKSALGSGSTFALWLPATAAPTDREEMIPATATVTGETSRLIRDT